MRCPECGYVSFNELGSCKRCGADLRELKHRRGIPTFTGVPTGPPPPRIPRLTAASAAGPAQKWDAFRLPLETLPLFDPSPGGVASSLGVQSDVSPPVKVSAPAKAGFWIRLAAWIVDLPFLFLTSILVALLASATVLLGGWLGGEINDQVRNLIAYSAAVILTLSGFVYQTLFVGAWGQTPGKMLCGLKIVRANGEEMTYGIACLRSVCWILSLVLFGLGFLMIAFTRQKRGLHDILAGTRVIRTSRRI